MTRMWCSGLDGIAACGGTFLHCEHYYETDKAIQERPTFQPPPHGQVAAEDTRRSQTSQEPEEEAGFDLGRTGMGWPSVEERTEIAWAAGFFDGEGSTSCTANNGKADTRIQLSIGQKDEGGNIASTLIRFQKAMKGLGHIYQKTRIGLEINQHQFLVCRWRDVATCLRLLWPYLSETKITQATRAIDKFENATGHRMSLL